MCIINQYSIFYYTYSLTYQQIIFFQTINKLSFSAKYFINNYCYSLLELPYSLVLTFNSFYFFWIKIFLFINIIYCISIKLNVLFLFWINKLTFLFFKKTLRFKQSFFIIILMIFTLFTYISLIVIEKGNLFLIFNFGLEIFAFFLILLLQTILLFVYGTGVFSLLCIRGTQKSRLSIIFFANDTTGIFIFILRYLLQFSRWCLVCLSGLLLTESLWDFLTTYYNYYYFIWDPIKQPFTLFFYSILLIKSFLEYVDFLFLVSVQLCIYVALIFWLLPFLFATNIKNFYEY